MPRRTPGSHDAVKSAPFAFEAKDLAVTKLLLDPNNYRFLDHAAFKKRAANRAHEESVQRATLDSLERHYQLDELKQSILTNGYVPLERIITVPYPQKSGLFLVVEGNRRIAALKSILKEEADGVRKLTSAQRASFSKVPCAVLTSSGADLKHAERIIMGIRHIAGPKEWGAYQQAALVSELKNDEGMDFGRIGEALGMSSVEAARRYRAIGALQQMENDELYKRKAEPAYYRLFHELVAQPSARARFGWSNEEDRFTDLERAREFFGLITGIDEGEPKLKTYLDVRKLKAIVGHAKAEAALFDPDQPFAEALRIAEQGKSIESGRELLEEARATLSRIGLLEARRLGPEDALVIDELLQLLSDMKKTAVDSPTA